MSEDGRYRRLKLMHGWLRYAIWVSSRSSACSPAINFPLYDQLPGGLIAFYRAAGFTVEHIPAKDHQHPPLTTDHLQAIASGTHGPSNATRHRPANCFTMMSPEWLAPFVDKPTPLRCLCGGPMDLIDL